MNENPETEKAPEVKLELRSDIIYDFGTIHNSPLKQEFREYLFNIHNQKRTYEDKKNWKTLHKKVSYNNPGAKDGPIRVVNEWVKYMTPNAECPCGSKRKWKKCCRRVMSPYIPVEKYFKQEKENNE